MEQEATAVTTMAIAEQAAPVPGAVQTAVLPAPATAASPRSLRERFDPAAKRALDIVMSLLALVVLAPLIGLVALAIVLDTPGPVFFRARRLGFLGRDLSMLKFRKMHESATGLPLTMDDDHRLTRVGAFLARTKLDELPQFWHVLTGEMSLVGPRPETFVFVSHHTEHYDEILSVRPGLVGFSQIAFHSESRILDDEDPLEHYVSQILPQKVLLDLMYARRRSLGLDLRILLWSVVSVVLRRQVAVHRGTGRMRLRRR